MIPTGPAEPRDRNDAWDGLRGVAVAGVLVYHVEGHPLPGGFLGVSLFFTLSGFLITSLLADRLDGGGSIGFADFWARRFRRLLPAMVATLALCLAFGWWAANANQRDALPWDSVSALTGWSNWRFWLTGAEYGGQQLVASPLLHTWSLSIELQAYLVIPLVLAVAWRRGGRRAAIGALGVLTAVAAVAGALTASDAQQWYLGTHVRVAEILVGAVAALVLHGARRERAEQRATVFVPFVLVAMAAMWWLASESATWLPRGGLLVHAAGTVVLVLACSAGWFARAMAWRPLVALGRISYGVYLYHWPIYLWVTPRRLDLDRWPTTAVRLLLTLTLATASYWLLEQRVLQRRDRTRRALGGAVATMAATTMAVVALSPAGAASDRITITDGLVAPPASGAPPVSLRPTTTTTTTTTTLAPTTTGAPDEGAAPDTPPPTTPAPPPPPPAPEERLTPLLPAGPTLDRPPRILMVGDSALATLGLGVQRWASFLGVADVFVAGWIACPVTLGGEIRWNDGVVARIDDHCAWRQKRADEVRRVDPDLVVVMSGIWEVADRRFPGASTFVHVGEPEMDLRIAAAFGELFDVVSASGARVLWLRHPPLRNSIYAGVPGPLPEEDPRRMDRLNEIVEGLLADRPDTWVLDLPAVLADRYGDPLALTNRIDGFHWSDAGADLEGEWLVPLLTALAGGAAGPGDPGAPTG